MINKIQKYGVATLVATLFGACSGDAGFSSQDEKVEEPVAKSVELTIGQAQEIQAGDTLTPLTDDTEINVEHIIGEDIKRVTLLQGEATLVYGDYTLEESN